MWNLSPVSRAWAGRWRQWQQDAGSGRWNATGRVSSSPALDDSVRCRHSGICMGAKACTTGGEPPRCAWSHNMLLHKRTYCCHDCTQLPRYQTDGVSTVCCSIGTACRRQFGVHHGHLGPAAAGARGCRVVLAWLQVKVCSKSQGSDRRC